MSERCSGCGWHSCRCEGAEFHVGDVIVRIDDPEGPRYHVTQCMPGWFAGHRIHKNNRDGTSENTRSAGRRVGT